MTKPKPLDEALEHALNIFATLQDNDCQFIYCRKPIIQAMVFTAVNDCDLVKKLVPEFELRQDSRRERFVELTIYYE